MDTNEPSYISLLNADVLQELLGTELAQATIKALMYIHHWILHFVSCSFKPLNDQIVLISVFEDFSICHILNFCYHCYFYDA